MSFLHRFNTKFFIIFGGLLVVFILANARGENVIGDEEYSLDNDYYDQTYNFEVHDPYEKFNRRVYKFNKVIDKYIINPPAQIYAIIIPNRAKKLVKSFITNIREPLNFFYGVIQLKPDEALNSFFRFFINTTFGMLGIFDVAELMGLKKKNVSFANVLAYYGARRGPYIILPVLGPSNLRDGFGSVIDIGADPINLVQGKNKKKFSRIYYGTNIIVSRGKFIGVDKTLSEVSLDEYYALRNFYYQKLNRKDNYE